MNSDQNPGQSPTASLPPRRPSFLEAVKQRPVVCDGAMGTMLYEHGYFINRSFDEANLIRADTVRRIHEAYLAAGAEVLETNTFSANRFLLARYGIPEKVREVNRAGVQIARQAAGDQAWVAGSVGPTGEGMGVIGDYMATEIAGAYEEQISALVDAGCDLLVLETFGHLGELRIALSMARRYFGGPIVAQMSFQDDGRLRDGSVPREVAEQLASWGADLVGANCSTGPATLFDVVKDMVQVGIPVTVQPNAGEPRRLDQRAIYMATPEYFGVFARRFLKAGAAMVGGCCGTRPDHINAVSGAVRMAGGGAARSGATVAAAVREAEKQDSLEPVATETKSRLAAKVMEVWRTRLDSGARTAAPSGPEDFVVSVEVNPSPGLTTSKPLKAARMLKEAGVDVINIADGPRAAVRMSNAALAQVMTRELETEVILHVCCRDRNLLGLQSDVLGAHVLGLHNLVVITGDPPKLGDYPKATAVFDLDSIELLHLLDGLNRGIDPAGKMVGEQTSFFLATGAEPAAQDYDRELRRLERKVRAGAEMIMTQPVYDPRVVRRFLDDVKSFERPVLLGLCPLVSHRNAEFLHNEVPGMTVPEDIRSRMQEAGGGKPGQAAGAAIAREMREEFQDQVVGVYIMPQLGRYRMALEVLAGMGYGEPPPR